MSAGERGQATIETVAGAVVLVIAGLLALQLLGAGYAAVMAGNAAEQAALAVARGRSPRSAALDAVPGWPAGAMSVTRVGGRVRVELRPPSLFGMLGRRLAIRERAYVRAPRTALR